MPSVAKPSSLPVLVLGAQEHAQRRATQLRLHGIPAWVASNDLDLAWLMTQGQARPELTVVELSHVDTGRQELVATMQALTASAGLPTLLIGAEAPEVARFEKVIATFPSAADPELITQAVSARRELVV